MRQYKVFVIFIQVILSVQIAVAGFERTSNPTTVLARTFGGTGMFSSDNLWLNPASIAHETGLHGSVFYTPSPFQLDQLASYGMIVTDNYSSCAFGFGVQSFGFSLYRETIGSICAAYTMSDDLAVGASFHLYHLSIERYGSAFRPVVDAGVLYSLTDGITMGTAIHNLTGNSFGGDDDIPQKISSGFSFKIEQLGMVTADIVKDIRYPVYYNGSIEIYPHELLTFRLGLDGSNSMFSAGIGIILNSFQFNYGISSHPLLGLTHSIGVTL